MSIPDTRYSHSGKRIVARKISAIDQNIVRWVEAGEDFSHFRTLFDLNGNDCGRAKLG